jgi:hypothetical protein
VRELLWDEIRRRPPDRRAPIILMMDEFQNYADLNTVRSVCGETFLQDS